MAGASALAEHFTFEIPFPTLPGTMAKYTFWNISRRLDRFPSLRSRSPASLSCVLPLDWTCLLSAKAFSLSSDDSGRWGRGGLFTALEARSAEPRKVYELAGKMRGKKRRDERVKDSTGQERTLEILRLMG